MKTNRSSKNGKADQLANDLHEAIHAIAAANDLCTIGIGSPDDATTCLQAIQALLEKGGYLADKSLQSLGRPGVMGSYDRWRSAPDTQEASHD